MLVQLPVILPLLYCQFGRKQEKYFVLDNSDDSCKIAGMVAPRKKQPAFWELNEHDKHVSLWVNRTLLPSLSTALLNHQHPSLQDFSIACSQAYRAEMKSHTNEHCSIKVATMEPNSMPGATLTFHKLILDAASKAFMGSRNRAIGKIGLKFREIQRKQMS